MDILRTVRVQVRISEDAVEVTRPGRSWRLDDANRIVLGLDRRQRRVIHGIGTPGGIGDRTDAAVSMKGVQVLRAFDAFTFDPDVSSSATRYWSFQGVTAGGRHSTLAFIFARPALQLVWPAWDALPSDARRRYLDVVSRWADVVVNGRSTSTWRLFRRLLRRPPQVCD